MFGFDPCAVTHKKLSSGYFPVGQIGSIAFAQLSKPVGHGSPENLTFLGWGGED